MRNRGHLVDDVGLVSGKIPGLLKIILQQRPKLYFWALA